MLKLCFLFVLRGLNPFQNVGHLVRKANIVQQQTPVKLTFAGIIIRSTVRVNKQHYLDKQILYFYNLQLAKVHKHFIFSYAGNGFRWHAIRMAFPGDTKTSRRRLSSSYDQRRIKMDHPILHNRQHSWSDSVIADIQQAQQKAFHIHIKSSHTLLVDRILDNLFGLRLVLFSIHRWGGQEYGVRCGAHVHWRDSASEDTGYFGNIYVYYDEHWSSYGICNDALRAFIRPASCRYRSGSSANFGKVIVYIPSKSSSYRTVWSKIN